VTDTESLTSDELDRYARPLALDEWGEDAQLAVKRAGALVVGAGALGSPVALYLAAAGVGRLGILDSELVEPADLARQVAHFTPDVGQSKAQTAAFKLRYLNPEVRVETYPARLDEDNAPALIESYDVVADCSGTRATHHAVNDACCAASTPLVTAGLAGFGGWVLAVRPGSSACYRCVFGDRPSAGPARMGALGPVAGVVGSLQALEALALLAGAPAPVLDRVLRVDLGAPALTAERTARRAECPACGATPAPGT
jgi:molybdopterin/thiamine biosynthesis adenylyltransferase